MSILGWTPAGCRSGVSTASTRPSQRSMIHRRYTQILAETGPQEFAIIVLAEPVYVENLRQIVEAFGKRQPMGPVIGEVVAAKRFHRHRVTPDNADLANVGGGGFRRCSLAPTRTPCVPVLGFVNQRCHFFAAAAKNNSRNGYTVRRVGELMSSSCITVTADTVNRELGWAAGPPAGS